MNDEMLDYKLSEYTGRLGAAALMRKWEAARTYARTLLILYRHKSRAAVQETVRADRRLRAIRRGLNQMKERGVRFPLGEEQAKRVKAKCETAEKELASIGERISNMLDIWQGLGATMEDLCNLCNCNLTQVLAKLDTPEMPFSQIACVYNLDYKNPRDTGWIEDEVDAPFTHALKAHLMDIMLHTKDGRKAAHEAMEAVFPEIMENAMTMVTDADGVTHLVDQDGVEVGTMDEDD